MKMFDYAMFTRLLEIGLNPNSNVILYVCSDRNKKKSFKKRQLDLSNKLIYTINEIWDDNVLINKHYREYKFIK